MDIVFRVDASSIAGSGHVVRCLTLANAFREEGGSALFVCREHEGHLGALIRDRGHALALLPKPTTGFDGGGASSYAAWLGASWETDATETCAVVLAKGARPDWIVSDHYALDWKWQRAVSSIADKLLVIDDLADRAHECSMLLDQNLIAGMHERYLGKVPPECATLLGPDFALLQPEYSLLHRAIKPRRGRVRRLFVFFGGADVPDLTGRSLAAFLSLKRSDVAVDVVVSATSPHRAAIARMVDTSPNIRLHGSLPTLASLMAQSDLAIGASGTTNWERLCLGLPSIVVSLADNQVPVASCLHERSLVDWIGRSEDVSQDDIARALSRALDQDSVEEWSARCLTVCSGYGTTRVLDAMKSVSQVGRH